MIDSGEAESRAVAGAVHSAISQTRLDAGMNLTGLLVDIDSADSVDYRQHLMCWQLTRVFRPSLTEKVPPTVVRRVVEGKTALPPIGSPNHMSWIVGSLLDRTWVPLRGTTQGWPELNGGGDGIVSDKAGAGLQSRRQAPATTDTGRDMDTCMTSFFSVGSVTG